MREFICEFCQYAANTDRGLKIHRTKVHKEEIAAAKLVVKVAEASPDPIVEEIGSIFDPIVEEVAESVVEEVPTMDITAGGVLLGQVKSFERSEGSIVAPVHELSVPKIAEPVVEEVAESVVEAPPEPVILESVVESVEEPPFITATPEPVVEEPVEAEGGPFPEEPTPAPQEVGIKSIPVGARVILNGTFWNKNDAGAYVDKAVSSLECRVNDKLEQGGFMYLQMMGSDNSDWCCVEDAVLDGTIKLISLKDPTVTPFAPPEPVQEENLQAKVAYLEACTRYTEARDANLSAKKTYDEIDSETRPTILAYVNEKGSESKEGKRDSMLKEGGFEVHHTFSEGKVSIKRDTQKIIEWCMANGHPYAIQPSLNLDQWEALVERGAVPPEFLTQVQTPIKAENKRRLLITGSLPESE